MEANSVVKESSEFYDLAKKLTLKAGIPYTDPRTNKTIHPDQDKKVCARCHKPKKVLVKHHFPVGSKRTALICNHCNTVIRNQRKRSANFRGRL